MWDYLNHTWSLSFEEQFYVVWPLTLLAILRWCSERVAMAVLGFAIVITAGLRVTDHLDVAWGIVAQRPDALAWGALLALALRCWPGLLRWAAPPWVGVVAIAALLVLMGAWGHGLPLGAYSRGLYSLAGLVIAVLVAHVTFGSGPVVGALSIRPCVWIGLLSYSLYLWHVPVYRWFGDHVVDLPGTIQIPAKIAVAFALAVLSHLLIERPALRYKARFSVTDATSRAPIADGS